MWRPGVGVYGFACIDNCTKGHLTVKKKCLGTFCGNYFFTAVYVHVCRRRKESHQIKERKRWLLMWNSSSIACYKIVTFHTRICSLGALVGWLCFGHILAQGPKPTISIGINIHAQGQQDINEGEVISFAANYAGLCKKATLKGEQGYKLI